MTRNSNQFTAPKTNVYDPTLLAGEPYFDAKVYRFVGVLPFDLRSYFIFVRFLMLTSGSQVNLKRQHILDKGLTKELLKFHKEVAEHFHLEPFSEVQICQNWIVAVVKQDSNEPETASSAATSSVSSSDMPEVALL